jgi:16S rRNA G966 N2-methylase RsmD
VTEQIASHIIAPAGGRLLDPCAGEGTALVAFAEMLGLEPYGVELHEQRATAARQALADLRARRGQPVSAINPLIGDSYLSLRTSRAGYNFLYLNPPYDEDEEDGRLEYQWLTRCRPWLQAGGLLVWVVPQHLLRFRKATRYILSWFDRVRVYRFPDEAYERFKQIVLFGVQRERAQVASGETVERLAQAALDKTALPPLTVAAEAGYSLPPLAVKGKAFTFRSLFIDPADALAEARQWGVGRLAAWREHLDPASVGVALQPLTPLKIGHMHNVIAAGHLNNQVLTDEEMGERLLINGRYPRTFASLANNWFSWTSLPTCDTFWRTALLPTSRR